MSSWRKPGSVPRDPSVAIAGTPERPIFAKGPAGAMGPGFRQDDMGEAMPVLGNAQHRTQRAFDATNGGRRRSAGESDAERPTIDVDADCRRHRRAAVWIDAVQPGPHARPDGG